MNEALLRQFVENKEMVKSVREFFLSLKATRLAEIDTRKYDNENLGSLHRGIDEGSKWIESAFTALQRYSSSSQSAQVGEMPGR